MVVLPSQSPAQLKEWGFTTTYVHVNDEKAASPFIL